MQLTFLASQVCGLPHDCRNSCAQARRRERLQHRESEQCGDPRICNVTGTRGRQKAPQRLLLLGGRRLLFLRGAGADSCRRFRFLFFLLLCGRVDDRGVSFSRRDVDARVARAKDGRCSG